MNPRLAELIERARDGALPEVEDQELAVLLQDPVARVSAVTQWRDGLLVAALGGRPAEEVAALARAAGASRASRVHRQVRARVTRRRRNRWSWGLVAGLIAAVLVAAVGLQFAARNDAPSTPPALPVAASPAASVPKPPAPIAALASIVQADRGASIQRDGSTLPATVGVDLRRGDRLRAVEGPLVLRYAGEATTVALAPRGELALDGDAARKRIELASGTITAAVEHQRPGSGLLVVTAQAQAEVVGTRFTLAADAGSSRLEVQEGRVRFARAAEDVEVAAGQYAIAEAGAALVARPLVASRAIDDLEGALAWIQRPECSVLGIDLVHDQVHGGQSALRLAYRPKASDQVTWGTASRPLRLQSGDRALRLWLLVEEQASGSNWNLQFRQRDTTCWMIGGGHCDELQPGWNRIELTLPRQPQLVSDPVGPYDPAAVEELLFSICLKRATLIVDDLALIPASDSKP